MANPELGAKQICPNCRRKFYDLGRRPAVCPKCATEFDPEEALRRPPRARPRHRCPTTRTPRKRRQAVAAEAEDGFEDEVDETPEVDEAVEAEPLETATRTRTPWAPPRRAGRDLGVDFAEDEELEDATTTRCRSSRTRTTISTSEIEGLPDEGEED